MSGPTRLFANLGAEEPDAWQRMSAHPRVRTAARLWAALFPAGARLVGPGAPEAPRLAAAFACDAERPALPFCAPGESLVPWLATEQAERLAREEGVPFAPPPAEVVTRVHDKAFAQEAALASGLVPPPLVGATLALGPEELVEADAVRCRIESAVARWPLELRARFTVKPRLGTSGRGRLDGADGRIDAELLSRSLSRLRDRGGALIEPWLERMLDLSAQLLVSGPDEVRVLGTLRQVVSARGAPTGHVGRIDREGEVDSGTAWDAALREAALAIGRAAAREGFRGACGVDAFVFRGSDGARTLRPVVELNARFTMGTVALGHLARAVRAGLARGAGAFYFGFAPGAGAWPSEARRGARLEPILDGDPSARLCLATDELALADALPTIRRSE
ncbi:MAG: hypothetical protein FJ108_08715 [Deltaproteobacteria bacterium]|nr:hypothetical protein [Deltaproteobacteria bacterium]